MDATELLAGDFIQARMHGPTEGDEPDQWLVTEFIVTSVTDTTVHGSVIYPDGLDEAAGWGFELISRTLTLPDTVSEIVAQLTDGRALTLMGKGAFWTDTTTGQAIPVDLIQSFTLTT